MKPVASNSVVESRRWQPRTTARMAAYVLGKQGKVFVWETGQPMDATKPIHTELGDFGGLISAVTTDHEHIVEALGAGAVLLAGLSFLPRRRALATKRSLEPRRCSK